jgi:molybdopterin synthase catalytic subunit
MKSSKNIFVRGSIPPEMIVASIRQHNNNPDIGAHGIFLGQVRADTKEGGSVQSIDFSVYEDMAMAKVHEIREDIFAKYPITCLHVYHSIGKVPAGEICLFVFTLSKHRNAAMDACKELVERIKKELPVWGREIIDEEQSVWKINS